MNENNLPKLPKGWVWTRLGEICSNEKNKSIESATPYLEIGDIDTTTKKYIFKEKPAVKGALVAKKGDILLSRVRPTRGAITIVKEDKIYVSSALTVFRPFLKIPSEYIHYFLAWNRTFLNFLGENSTGTMYPTVKENFICDHLIPLPPLFEQHRIVTKIEELFTKLDAGLNALTKAKAQIKRYRQAVLKSAFEGRLTEEWRKANKDKIDSAPVLLEQIKEERKKKFGRKYKELPPVETSEIPELPEGWCWAKIVDIGDVVTGTTPRKAKKEYYGTDYPFYKPTDLNDGYYVKKSGDGLSQEGIEKARLLPVKSILVTCIGATIGKTGFIRTEGAFNQQINAIIPEKHILPEFVYFMCISYQFQKSIIDNASATTLPILNKSKFEILLIPLPSLSEQHRIVEEIERRLSIADETEKTIDQSLKQAERLRQSILKKVFEGKLVPQDPTDEPAEKFLERIKEEKAKQEVEKISKRRKKGD
jgi:type I restriction enzyme S subunit